jgi:hypothetical protein
MRTMQTPYHAAQPASTPRPQHAADVHTITLASAYGDLLDSAEVPDDQLRATLRRFYNGAIQRPNAVVVLDGVMHSRNAFLDFVRHFNDWADRRAAAGH